MGQIGKCLVLPLGYVNFTIVIFRPIQRLEMIGRLVVYHLQKDSGKSGW